MHWPVWIAEHLSGQKHQVSFTIRDHRVGLVGLSDQTDRGRGNPGFAADSGCKRHLKAWGSGDLCVGHQGARRTINKVNAVLAKKPGKRNGLFHTPSAVDPIRGGDADKERQMYGPLGANGIHNLQHQPGAVFEAAAIFIGPLIRQWRQKLVKQIAMCGVNLNKVKASFKSPSRCLTESFHHRIDARLVEGLGNGIAL